MPNTACIEYGRALLISHDGKKVRRWKERFDKIGRTYPFKADYQCYAEIFDMITAAAANADGVNTADSADAADTAVAANVPVDNAAAASADGKEAADE